MQAETIKSLLENVGKPISHIEQEIGIPKTALQKAINGKRGLPKRWSIALRNYVESKQYLIAVGIESPKPENKKELKKTKKVTPAAPKVETSGDVTYKPKNLAELKDLCPKNLEGVERSAWISENRLKYGV